MPLSWNEIRQRSITFVREWRNASRERAEAQTFWNEFFDVFGIRRRVVASFEEPVRNLGGAFNFIDLFWRGKLIAEHKSRGQDLDRAHTQAIDYIQNLQTEGRTDEIPQYIVVSDFARIALHNLEETDPARQSIEFPLSELPNFIRHFAFIPGYETRRLDEEDPANFEATELLANLHDRLEDGGYRGHDLQRFMVRILFCLFAEDTGIFEPEAFTQFIKNRTDEDGSDSGAQLSRLFEVLNRPIDRRQATLDEDLASLPYVNGELFAERLDFPDFNSAMRTALLSCCDFRWEKISPAVFGSLFQNIMNDRERRQIGAHYTSERDIMKLIRSLFLDDLRAEFESIKRDRSALARFHRRLGEMRFLDPACGCGNFLVIAYRELRRLELDIIQARFGDQPTEGDIRAEARLNVSQFYGIEIEEWPVRIAEVAMWLMDHQMNNELFERFGQQKATVPLTSSPHITHANALRIDWNELLPREQCTYILGNPPFVGAKEKSASQRADIDRVWGNLQGRGTLDYVSCWYKVACNFATSATRIAFVSTNSITQGEQVGVLWPALQREHSLTRFFAHRTFSWTSEARGRAHVHVVIIGFTAGANNLERVIFDYDHVNSEPTKSTARFINAYLVDGPDVILITRSRRLCTSPEMMKGSELTDDGHLVLTATERLEAVAREPEIERYIRRFGGGKEYINNIERYCLWLRDAQPNEIRRSRFIQERLDQVRQFRSASAKARTQSLAACPAQFGEDRQPDETYLLIPKVSSQTRQFVPMGFAEADFIVNGSALVVPGPSMYDFGVLTSTMHMAWMRQVCGRMKSDYQYSVSIVYNNFPWPQDIADAKRHRVEESSQAVLDARAQFPNSTLADLYDPNAMPADLRGAHDRLDRAVDACYRRQPFTSERQRLEFLFQLYEQLTAPLTARPTRRRRQQS